ncbi:MAG: S8 family serine peptidase [Pseudomonadota bacterium]
MARYVMASRRAGKFTEDSKAAAIRQFNDFSASPRMAEAATSMGDERKPRHENGRRIRIFESSEDRVADLIRHCPADVIIEPEVFYQTSLGNRSFGRFRTFEAAMTADASVFGAQRTITVTARGGGQSLANAEVRVWVQFGREFANGVGQTDATGQVTMSYPDFATPVAVLVSPYSGFWSTWSHRPRANMTVTCARLPRSGPQDWWHRAVGTPRSYDPMLGNGIRVGVIDTGCGPHGGLAHVQNVGAFIGQNHNPGGGADVDSHGTHVCGIIGARPAAAGEYGGIAPGCDLMSARVFATSDGAANIDIADAIDFLSKDEEADLINLSLGGEFPSIIVRDALQDAEERGSLCIAAAGNSEGAVNFPAANPECVAVSALGLLGETPPNSYSADAIPNDPNAFGFEGIFMAGFSCRGPEIELTGPGVGVVSTVPERFGLTRPYKELDGTSMASPAATGAIAAILSRSPTYAGLERNGGRTAFARNLAGQFGRDAGLDPALQGRGLPNMRGVHPSRDVHIV